MTSTCQLNSTSRFFSKFFIKSFSKSYKNYINKKFILHLEKIDKKAFTSKFKRLKIYSHLPIKFKFSKFLQILQPLYKSPTTEYLIFKSLTTYKLTIRKFPSFLKSIKSLVLPTKNSTSHQTNPQTLSSFFYLHRFEQHFPNNIPNQFHFFFSLSRVHLLARSQTIVKQVLQIYKIRVIFSPTTCTTRSKKKHHLGRDLLATNFT